MPGSLGRWPDHVPRADSRERTTKFDMSNGKIARRFLKEIERYDADEWEVYTGNRHTQSNGLPLADANPDDPGFAVKWSRGGQTYAVGCDKWTDLFDNVREVTIWLKEERMSNNRPVETAAADSFAHAALPAGEDSAHDEEPDIDDPYAVLGIREDAPEYQVEAAFDAARENKHPDNGGSAEEFIRAKTAYEMILEDGGDDLVEVEG